MNLSCSPVSCYLTVDTLHLEFNNCERFNCHVVVPGTCLVSRVWFCLFISKDQRKVLFRLLEGFIFCKEQLRCSSLHAGSGQWPRELGQAQAINKSRKWLHHRLKSFSCKFLILQSMLCWCWWLRGASIFQLTRMLLVSSLTTVICRGIWIPQLFLASPT